MQPDGAEPADRSATLAAARAGHGEASARAFEAIYAELAPSVASYLRMSAVPDVEARTSISFHRSPGCGSVELQKRASMTLQSQYASPRTTTKAATSNSMMGLLAPTAA